MCGRLKTESSRYFLVIEGLPDTVDSDVDLNDPLFSPADAFIVASDDAREVPEGVRRRDRVFCTPGSANNFSLEGDGFSKLEFWPVRGTGSLDTRVNMNGLEAGVLLDRSASCSIAYGSLPRNLEMYGYVLQG